MPIGGNIWLMERHIRMIWMVVSFGPREKPYTDQIDHELSVEFYQVVRFVDQFISCVHAFEARFASGETLPLSRGQ